MASPTFSAANSPNAVKIEAISASATPRASIAIPTPINQSGSTTPRVSISVNPNESNTIPSVQEVTNTSTIKDQEVPVSLFDPTHLPSLFGRIRTISKLLNDASSDANSLSKSSQSVINQEENSNLEDQSSTIPTISFTSSSSAPAPNIALGATTDDDINSGYETALSMSFGGTGSGNDGNSGGNVQPTELAKDLVRESVDLRKAFNRAQKAIETFDGGDMDLEEQNHLISLLEQYSEEQRRIRHSFISRAELLDSNQKDSEMVDIA